MLSVRKVLAALRGRTTPEGGDRTREGATVSYTRLVLVGVVTGLVMGVGVYSWPAASRDMVGFADPGAAAVFATALTPVSYLLLTPVGWAILALRPGLDPRNVAIAANAVVTLAIVTLVGGSLLIDPGPGRLVLLMACVLVGGAAGGIVPQMLTTTVTHLRIRRGSAPALFFGVWAASFGSVFYAVARLAGSLGVQTLLWILAAVMVAAIPVPRLLPSHPDAGTPQLRWRQQWADAGRELNTNLVRTAFWIIALQGFAIAARFGPLSPVAEHYAEGGAPWAANAAEIVGIGIIAVALPQTIVGQRMGSHLKLILQISGIVVALGCAVGLLPWLFGDRIGGYTTVVSTLAVEAGHDICLMVLPAVLAKFASARPALAWQFAGKYVSSLAFVLVVLPVVAVLFSTVVLQNYALSAAGAVAGLISWALVPRFTRSYEQVRGGSN